MEIMNLHRQTSSISMAKNGITVLQNVPKGGYKNSSDEEKADATKRYRLAANAGDEVAAVYLEFKYYMSICANPDYVEAAKNYMKSATQGETWAQTLLAFMYYFGNGVSQNFAEAAKWFQAAAPKDEYAQICLGYILSCGIGVQENKVAAENCYRYAARYGDSIVQVHLADLFYSGRGFIWDRDFACNVYQNAALKGNAYAMFRMGEIWLERGNRDGAMEWYLRAAESGYGPAQFKLGDIYRQKGEYVSDLSLGKIDYIPEFKKKADEWFSKAAVWYSNAVERGYVYANTFLAFFYRKGLGGFEQDLNKATELYLKAAMHGYADAQFELGCIYEGEKNIPEAKKWLQKAADQGHYMADLLLCSIHSGEVMDSQRKAEKRLTELYY